MHPMTDDADATPATPDPDDHVARLQAQIDAAKARRAGYRAEAAETVARGGPVRPTDEELGIIKTDDTVGRMGGRREPGGPEQAEPPDVAVRTGREEIGRTAPAFAPSTPAAG